MPAYVFDKKTNELVKVAGNAANADLKDMNVYSTEEKIVGTWIDGKPIYRKTFVYEGATISSTVISMGSISSFGDVETIKGSLKFDRGNVIHLGYMNNDNNKVFEAFISDSGDVGAISPYNNSNSKIIITVEYTKTTD